MEHRASAIPKEANDIPNDTEKKSFEKKPSPKTNMEQNTDKSQVFFIGSFMLSILLLKLATICINSGKVEAGMPEGLSLSPRNLLKNTITTLKANFPSQEKHLWDTVSAAVNYHIRSEEPDGPIILLFGSPPDASETLRCLVEQLGRIISKTFGSENTFKTLGRDGTLDAPHQFNGQEFKNEDADKAKKKMDDLLREAFLSGHKVATVLNLDALPPCSVLLFHGFCDTDNAVFKNVAFIFTITLDGVLSREHDVASNTMDVKTELDNLFVDHLKRVWVDKCSDLPEEKVEALLSRISNNIGYVRNEKSLQCKND